MVRISIKLSVIAYLPKSLQSRLQMAIQTPHFLTCAESWSDVTFLLRRTHVDVFFVDPSLDNPPATPTIVRILEEFPSVAVVIYGPLSPTTVRVVRDLSKRGLYEIVLSEFDDTPAHIGLLLDGIPPSRLVPLLFFHIQDELSRLPPNVGKRIRSVFESPFMIRSVEELATFTNLSRTLLYEAFENAGLGSPKRLIIAARLLRAYVYLCDPGHAFRFVVKKTGFVEYRALRSHLVNAFGMPVSQLRQCEDQGLLVRRLVAWMKGEQHTPSIIT
jgi:AraC-like DNA-binding protein